jgi:hypothetical protein
VIVPYHYRITVDALDPTPGEEGLQSLSFFASTHTDIFAAVGALRDRLECTACHATRLAVGLSLLSEVVQHECRAGSSETRRERAVGPQAAQLCSESTLNNS